MKNASVWILSLVMLALPATAFSYTFDNDVPATIKKQITDDMTFMSTLQGVTASGLHKQIFGDKIDGAGYKKWFEGRVMAVGMNDCGGGKAVACVIPFFDSSKIWLTQNYVKFSHPQVAKMMVVFHEARHTEDAHGNWGHATCPTPFLDKDGSEMKSIWTGATLAGEPACDETPFGSYGSSMILLKNISKFCTNCTDKVKMDAGIYADDQFKRIIDKAAIEQITNDLYK
jgi:hypothetical protein